MVAWGERMVMTGGVLSRTTERLSVLAAAGTPPNVWQGSSAPNSTVHGPSTPSLGIVKSSEPPCVRVNPGAGELAGNARNWIVSAPGANTASLAVISRVVAG